MKTLRSTRLQTALAATCGLTLTVPCARAATVTLLEENFDAAAGAATIQSVLSSHPSSLPAGTTWSSTANANAVNLRAGTDAINTYNSGNPLQRFALSPGTNFFLPATAANKFLVMGDDSGQLAGSPTTGTFGFALPFSLASGTTDITVSFDWVFSAFLLGSGGDTDRFAAGVAGSGYSVNAPLTTAAEVVNQSITASGKAHGSANVTIPVDGLGDPDANGQHWLSFGYFENSSSATNGAVGVDNIRITANVAPVPVPAAVWLFGPALAGMGLLERRGRAASPEAA